MLLYVTNVVVLDPNISLWVGAFVAGAATVIANGIKTLLLNGLSTLPIKDKPVFSNDPRSLPKNSPHCPVWYNWVLHFIGW